MGLLDDLATTVSGYLAGNYETYEPKDVPLPEEVGLGNKAAKLTATALFIDVRQSSDITEAFRLQTAAKMMKAYFHGAVKVVRANSGHVRSFNGDGMLALFMGDTRSSNATKAAMQVRWFVDEVLQPQFRSYFRNNLAALGKALDFSIGCGLDDGQIFAVRVGIKGTNDVAWVGRATNTAAKLASFTDPNRVRVTRAVYQRLNKDRKYSGDQHMWSDEVFKEIGGVSRAYRWSTWRWKIS
jgi:class 3 adenylate cyclase